MDEGLSCLMSSLLGSMRHIWESSLSRLLSRLPGNMDAAISVSIAEEERAL